VGEEEDLVGIGGTEYDIVPDAGDKAQQEGGDGRDAGEDDDRGGGRVAGSFHDRRNCASGTSMNSESGGEGHGS
jgi:hypothetical protein